MTQNQQSETTQTEQVWRPGFGWVERPVVEAEVIELRRKAEQDERKRA